MQIDCIMSAVLNVNNTHESIRSPSLYSVVRSEKEGGGLTIWKASVDGKATHGSISDYIFAHGIRMRNDYDNTTKGGRRRMQRVFDESMYKES